MQVLFDVEKMFTFLRGVVSFNELPNTAIALNFAREQHKHQLRKDGKPYIVHPLTMTCDAVAMGIKDDVVLASLLLHDVIEDCDVLIDDLPVNEKTKEIVSILTFVQEEGEDKNTALKRYYKNIAMSKEATLAKLIDRCHNVSTMSGVFSKDKLLDYIKETEEYIIPLYREAKIKYPDYSSNFFILKYHIVSVINSITNILII